MSVAVRRALYGKMAGDSTLVGYLGTPPSGYSKSIYYQVAPDGAQFPFIVFSKQASTPRYAFGARAYDTDVWLIKGVIRSSGPGGDSPDAVQTGAAADAHRHGAAADAAVNGAPDIRATHLDVRARHAAIDLQLARGQFAAPRSVGSQALQHGGWSAVGLLRGRHTQSARRPRGRVGVPRLDGRCQAGSHLRAARRAWRPH